MGLRKNSPGFFRKALHGKELWPRINCAKLFPNIIIFSAIFWVKSIVFPSEWRYNLHMETTNSKGDTMRKVQVKQLKRGDKVGSGETVISVSGSGLNCKCTVVLMGQNNKIRHAEWNPNTFVGVQN